MVLQNLCNRNVPNQLKMYDRAVLLWSRSIVLATTLPNKEGSWVLGLQGSVAKILQNPVPRSLDLCECEKITHLSIHTGYLYRFRHRM